MIKQILEAAIADIIINRLQDLDKTMDYFEIQEFIPENERNHQFTTELYEKICSLGDIYHDILNELLSEATKRIIDEIHETRYINSSRLAFGREYFERNIRRLI